MQALSYKNQVPQDPCYNGPKLQRAPISGCCMVAEKQKKKKAEFLLAKAQ